MYRYHKDREMSGTCAEALLPTELPFREASSIYTKRFFGLFVLIGAYFLLLGITALILKHPVATLSVIVPAAIVSIVAMDFVKSILAQSSFLRVVSELFSELQTQRLILARKLKLAKGKADKGIKFLPYDKFFVYHSFDRNIVDLSALLHIHRRETKQSYQIRIPETAGDNLLHLSPLEQITVCDYISALSKDPRPPKAAEVANLTPGCYQLGLDDDRKFIYYFIDEYKRCVLVLDIPKKTPDSALSNLKTLLFS